MSTEIGCNRNLNDHCCWLNGVACPHLETNVEQGFKYSCGLRRRLGNWEDVYVSEEYKKDVLPTLNRKITNFKTNRCGDYFCENCIDINGNT